MESILQTQGFPNSSSEMPLIASCGIERRITRFRIIVSNAFTYSDQRLQHDARDEYKE